MPLWYWYCRGGKEWRYGRDERCQNLYESRYEHNAWCHDRHSYAGWPSGKPLFFVICSKLFPEFPPGTWSHIPAATHLTNEWRFTIPILFPSTRTSAGFLPFMARGKEATHNTPFLNTVGLYLYSCATAHWKTSHPYTQLRGGWWTFPAPINFIQYQSASPALSALASHIGPSS